MDVTMIGLDASKASFQVHGVDEAGKVEVRRKLRRSEVIPFFEAQPACVVVLEACGAAHHWARLLTGLGHEMKLVAPGGGQTLREDGQEERRRRCGRDL